MIAAGGLLCALGSVSSRGAAPATPQGIITAKGFLNIGSGTTVTDLTGNAKFPDKPDVVYFYPYFEWNASPDGDITTPANNAYGDNYGAQMLGYFYPPATGDYVFWISSDDGGDLYLSTDDVAANKKLIAQESGWSNPRMWDTVGGGSTVEAKNSSTFAGTQWPTKDTINGGAKITLTKGKAYYIEALMKEGGGGDNLAVAVQAPDFSIDSSMPIPGQYLSSDKASGAPTFVTQPASQTVTEGQSVTFAVTVNGLPPYSYQWQKGTTAIADATNSTFVISRVALSDNNGTFACKVSNSAGSATSQAATLTVTADTTAPTVVKASADTSFTTVVVKYSEPVSDTALTASNYAIDQGVTISAVARVDAQTVSMATSKLTGGIIYNLTIKNVQDTASTPNTIAANTKVEVRPFVFASGTVVHQKYNDVSDAIGNTIDGLFDDPRFPGAPDRVDLLNTYEYPVDGATRVAADPVRNYFDCIEGVFMPPTTGNYVFFTAFADRVWLYLSTDETPANKYQIIGLQGWSDPRRWLTSHDYDTTLNRSDTATSNQWPDGSTIHLQAGKKYYMLLVHHDPSWAGGDWFAATYKLDTELDPEDTDPPKLTGSVIGTYLDPTGASITFTTQPQSGTYQTLKTATLTVAATGTSGYGSTVTYQWQTAPKGSSTWTDIAGATGVSFTTAALSLADDGKQYRAVASVPGLSQFSAVATISVVNDTTPPSPIVGAVKNGNNYDIGIEFDEPVDSAAGVQSNYSVSAGTITAFKYWPKSPGAVLTVSGLTAGSKYSVTIKNVGDTVGNKITSVTKEFTAGKMGWGAVGADELGLGSGVVAVGENGFDLYSDSIAEWSTYDEATFVYEQITGDFDKKLRVEYQDASSQWARAGLVCRDVTNFGVDRSTQEGGAAGRYQKVHVNPVGPTLTGPGTAGNGQWEGNRRLDTGAATTSAGGGGTPQYPNAWCRLQRKGDLFTIYRSDDGVNWTQLGTTTFTTPMPATLYVGPEYAPENGNVTNESDRGIFLARIRDYGDSVSQGATLSWQNTAAGLVITFTGTLQSADKVTGPWTLVPGSSPMTVPTGSGMKFYQSKQ